MIAIDGSQGEGGGQIVRTSLGLSMLTGQAVRLTNIRAGRRKPGLLQQHLVAVRAAQAVCDADVEGAELHGREVTFRPGRVRPGAHEFRIDGAGSATLVLQTLLPALVTAGEPSFLRIRGGTHNPFAPPFDFLARAFAPLVARTGARLELALDRWGFFPAGGGALRASVHPAARLQPFELVERGEIVARRATAVVANLPPAVADRELAVVTARLGLARHETDVRRVESAGPGNVVMVEIATATHTEVFTAFGERGVRAETVAEHAAREAETYVASGAPVSEHLADQLVIPLAMAGRGAYRIGPPSGHLTTNVDVVRRFLDVPVVCEPVGDGLFEVRA